MVESYWVSRRPMPEAKYTMPRAKMASLIILDMATLK